MSNLVDLYEWLDKEGVFVFNRQFSFANVSTKSATIRLKSNCTWGVFLDKTRVESAAEEKTILLHECGHYSTGATHEVCSPVDLIERHEYKADKWAVLNSISEEELDTAVAEGHTEIWDLAEHFNVTEEFICKVVSWYTYGNVNEELYF